MWWILEAIIGGIILDEVFSDSSSETVSDRREREEEAKRKAEREKKERIEAEIAEYKKAMVGEIKNKYGVDIEFNGNTASVNVESVDKNVTLERELNKLNEDIINLENTLKDLGV